MAAESDVDRVYRAVVAQEDEDKVRLLIEEFAQGSDKRRAALVNMPVKRAGDGKEETPLQAIVRIDPKSKLIPVLLEAGADVKAVYGGRVTALGLCDAADGGVDSFRKLLRAGHDPSERFLCEWHRDDPTPGGFATVLHQCAVQGKLEHVEFLVREGGMDIDLRGWQGLTPLHVFVLYCKVLDPTPALDLFASLGADFNARDSEGKTPIVAVPHNTAAMTSKLLARGASADVTDYQNRTPLMHACGQRVHNNPRRPDTINELLRCSSNETRRVASEAASTKGHSAIDALFFCDKDQQFEPWHLHVVSSLVDSGASVLPGHVDGLEAKLRELAAGEQSADWIKERVEVVCKQLQAFKPIRQPEVTTAAPSPLPIPAPTPEPETKTTTEVDEFVETAVGAIAECEPGASAGKEERVEVVGDQLCAVKITTTASSLPPPAPTPEPETKTTTEVDEFVETAVRAIAECEPGASACKHERRLLALAFRSAIYNTKYTISRNRDIRIAQAFIVWDLEEYQGDDGGDLPLLIRETLGRFVERGGSGSFADQPHALFYVSRAAFCSAARATDRD